MNSQQLFGTCGLASLQGFGSLGGAALLEERLKTANAAGFSTGNFMFSLTSGQINCSKDPRWAEAYKTVQMVLNHPNSRCIHAYANNAHGPSIIFIGMIHLYPSKVQCPVWENNWEATLARMDCTNVNQHVLKEEIVECLL